MALSSPRASARSYRIASPAFYGEVDEALEAFQDGDSTQIRRLLWQLIEWQRLSAEVINGLMDGKDNANGTVTLTANQATTTLQDHRIVARTKIVLIPTTANALADAPYQTYPNTVEGQAILNHANAATVDRTFAYALRG